MLGYLVACSNSPSVTLLQVGRSPRRIKMMNCHTPFLCVHTRSEHGGGAEQHTHRPGVHGIYHRLPSLVGLALLNEAHLAWRYAVVLRQFALDFRIDVPPIARLVSPQVRENELRAFLRVVFLIILRDYFGTVARLVVGVVFVMRVYHAHVQSHLPRVVGSDEHLLPFPCRRHRNLLFLSLVLRCRFHRADCGSCSKEIVSEIEKHCKHFYIRANRCSSLYNDIFALRGWKTEEINGIQFELNSILVEKWEGKCYRLVIQRQRRNSGDLDLWEGEYTYRCILTNDYKSSTRDIVEFYNLRGGKERIFDDMNNGFGWSRLPKSFMAENTVFLLLTALIHNFYKTIMSRLDTKAFGLKKTSRIKAFVFRFISVPAKWIMTARQYVLNIYTENRAYAKPFKTEFG